MSLENGDALRLFGELIKAQGGNEKVIDGYKSTASSTDIKLKYPLSKVGMYQ